MLKTELFGEETIEEPLGALSKEQKTASGAKVVMRRVGDDATGTWLPEFKGNIITDRDINLIVRSIRTGYRRHRSLRNLRARLEVSVKNEQAAKAASTETKTEVVV